MSDNPFPIQMPDPLVKARWAGQVRAVMPLIGGIVGTLGVTLPTFTDDQISNYVSTAMVLFGIVSWAWTAIWSARQKNAAEKAKREAEVSAAVASAQKTIETGIYTPVTVTVTPEGVPNEAVRVSMAEQRGTPSVPVDVTPSPAPRAT